jgi:predicted nucleic acid-binding protein
MGSAMIEKLIDSVIIIDHLNGIEAGTRYILGLEPGKTAISVITRAEILVGIEEIDEELVKAFLDQYRLLFINKAVADLAATLRRKYHWKLPDAFQAAISLNHNIKFSTRNTKDFDPSKHEFVEIPYTI